MEGRRRCIARLASNRTLRLDSDFVNRDKTKTPSPRQQCNGVDSAKHKLSATLGDSYAERSFFEFLGVHRPVFHPIPDRLRKALGARKLA